MAAVEPLFFLRSYRSSKSSIFDGYCKTPKKNKFRNLPKVKLWESNMDWKSLSAPISFQPPCGSAISHCLITGWPANIQPGPRGLHLAMANIWELFLLVTNIIHKVKNQGIRQLVKLGFVVGQKGPRGLVTDWCFVNERLLAMGIVSKHPFQLWIALLLVTESPHYLAVMWRFP